MVLNSKVKTIYSRLFIRRGWSMAFFLIMVRFGEMQIHFYKPNMSVFIIAIGNICYKALFSYTLISMNFGVKHFKTLKKHKLSL